MAMRAHDVVWRFPVPPCGFDVGRAQFCVDRRGLVRCAARGADVMERVDERATLAADALPDVVPRVLALLVRLRAKLLGQFFFVDGGLTDMGARAADVVVRAAERLTAVH